MSEPAAVIAGSIPVPMLEARGLFFSAGGRRLIDGLDLRIAPGRRTVIMGANGAGKSLCLRLLHGLIQPEAGRVLWQGHPLDREARFRQAMVFQRPVLLRRSVAANLRFALRARGIGGAEARSRMDEALTRARLTDLAKRPARVLSGGEQQRLAVARALACRPEMLFLDEPTASLDPASTAEVEALIETAHADGVSTVLVTHDAGQARRLADDVIFLHAGRVAEAGPAHQVLQTPRSAAAEAWLDGRLYFDTV
ncbi:MAG: phosphate ABC transporter ATP-binding protein [Paracoccaceae bacterium]